MRFYLSMLIAMCSVMLSAQNFAPGYIVNIEGDTLACEIAFPSDKFTPDFIMIRRDSEGSHRKIYPEEIQYFQRIIGRKHTKEEYVCDVVEIDTTEIMLGKLEYDAKLRLKTDRVFLKIEVNGDKALYSYNAELFAQQFYIYVNGAYKLLIYKKYLQKQVNAGANYKRIIKENNTYKGILQYYFIDYPQIVSQVQTMQYNRVALVSLFRKYNQIK